jgi:hypothetical protein
LHCRQVAGDSATPVSPFRDVIRERPLHGDHRERSPLQALIGIDHEFTRQALAIACNNSYLVAAMVLAALTPQTFLYREPRS